jgi:hypothetical protein
MAKEKRDSKDPMPTAANTGRDGKDGGGNTPVTGEKHDSKKAERVTVASRFDGTFKGDVNAERPMGGNTSKDGSGESHDAKKSEKIPASSRF